MKRLNILLLSVATLVSCHKDDAPTTVATTIEVTANDDNGKPVAGATVELFDLSTDPVNGSLIAKATSDANGKYLFTQDSKGNALQSLTYGYKAFTPQGASACKYGTLAGTSPIKANTTTTVTVIAKAQGYLQFKNSTDSNINFYLVTDSKSQKLNSSPFTKGTDTSTTQSGTPVPTGTYQFKYIKLDSSGKEISGADSAPLYITVTECGQMVVDFK